MDYRKIIEQPIFQLIQKVASNQNIEVYIVGGFVRDLILGYESKDIDILVVGNGIEFARSVADAMQPSPKVSVYKTFGTASLKYNDNWKLEFVGARKESYHKDSRKPDVEPGTLEDDLKRRDFTINAMAISLNVNDFGTLIDPFHGENDLKNKIICTPLDPLATFSDDPLRMMRAIRFATHLNFTIHFKVFASIKENAPRIQIVSIERTIDEFNKILMCEKPSNGLNLLHRSGLLGQFFPEFVALEGIEYIDGKGHKDNFKHTLEVLDKLSQKSDNLWLRWAALLHDIGKPATRRFDEETGWTFHGHETKGAKMVVQLFRKFKLPMNEKMEYVSKLVMLHLRPIALVDKGVTDSAIRRLIFEAGDLIDDLMTLCEADVTSKNPEKVKKYLENFRQVRKRINEVEERDRIRNFQPPITGDIIMEAFGIPPSHPVGVIKNAIKEAILEGTIHNDYEEAFDYMVKEGKNLGLVTSGNIEEIRKRYITQQKLEDTSN